MKGKFSIAIALIIAVLSGCASDAPPVATQKPPAAPYAQGAITLNVVTDTDLNAWHNIANSCTLLVIQAEKASTLNKLLASPAALRGLFSAAGAQDEILKVDRYAAMPGQHITLHIDRSENTRYVAIVAGYYPFPQQQHMVLAAVPVTSENTGWWKPVWHAQLSPLRLSLRLGREAISDITGATPLPLSLPQRDIAADGPQPAGGKKNVP